MKQVIEFDKDVLMRTVALLLALTGVVGCNLFSGNASLLSKQDPVKKKSVSPLPGPDKCNEKAPELFKVKFETTQGDFEMEIHRDWAPKGADRFYNLVKIGYFKDIAIFRAMDNFMFQFGIHGDPRINDDWADAKIKDDPVAGFSNTVGTLTFATGGKDSRSVQLFINLTDNSRLDSMGFTPIGKISGSAAVLGAIHRTGDNPIEVQSEFQKNGNEYIKKKYPDLDYIKSVTLVEDTKN